MLAIKSAARTGRRSMMISERSSLTMFQAISSDQAVGIVAGLVCPI
jgi:hypothetical protein